MEVVTSGWSQLLPGSRFLMTPASTSSDLIMLALQLSFLLVAIAAHYPSDHSHVLLFHNETTNRNISLGTAIENLTEDKHFYYALIGHPGKDKSNQLHLKSYNALSRLLNQLKLPAKASAFNNDFQHPELHPNTYGSYWGSTEWVVDYGQQLGVAFDQPQDRSTANFDFLGMIGHSWNDCIFSLRDRINACIHVVQLRNVDRFYPVNVTAEHLTPVYGWFLRDLESHPANMPTIFLFQQFDEGLDDLLKALKVKLDQSQHPRNVLGVVLAMMSKNATGGEIPCHDGSPTVPVLSFGSLLPDTYLMLQFNPYQVGVHKIYQLDVVKENETVVSEFRTASSICLTPATDDEPEEED